MPQQYALDPVALAEQCSPCHDRAARRFGMPLAALDRGEWEALCDGCGRCCVDKLEDEETGLLYPTNVACKFLDRRNGRCLDYKN